MEKEQVETTTKIRVIVNELNQKELRLIAKQFEIVSADVENFCIYHKEKAKSLRTILKTRFLSISLMSIHRIRYKSLKKYRSSFWDRILTNKETFTKALSNVRKMDSLFSIGIFLLRIKDSKSFKRCI